MIKSAAALVASAVSGLYLPKVAQAAATTDTWTGFTNLNWSANAPDINWTVPTAAGPFKNGDTVSFADQPAAPGGQNSYLVNLVGALTPAQTTVAANQSGAATKQYTFTGSGSIGGTGGFTVLLPSTAATVLIDNAAQNTYAGATTISSRVTFDIGNNDANGSVGLGGLVDSTGATVIVNRTDTALNIAGGLSGGGSFTINNGGGLLGTSAGTVTLSGTSTFTGALAIDAGSIIVGTGGTMTGSDTLTLNQGSLVLNGNATTIGAFGGLGSNVFGATFGGGFIENNSNTATTLNIQNTANSSSTFTGVIRDNDPIAGTTGKIALNVNLTGTTHTITLAPVDPILGTNVGNTYSGGTTLTAGTLAIRDDGSMGTAPGNANIGSTTVFAGGTLQFNNYTSNIIFNTGATKISLGANTGVASTLAQTNAISGASTLNYIGGGTLILGGVSNNYTGATSISGGELSISSLAQMGGGVGGLNITGGGDLQVTGTSLNNLGSTVVNSNTFNGGYDINSPLNIFTVGTAISGSGNLTKLGTGTLINNGVDSSTGAVTVAAGTLIANGANTYTGGTTISSGAVMQLGSFTALGSAGGATTDNGLLDLHGFTATVSSFSGAGIVDNLSAGGAALTFGNANATSTFSGIIRSSNLAGGGVVSVTKIGQGTITLSGSSSYTGGTTIATGTLAITNDLALGSFATNAAFGSAGVTFAGGTLQLNNYSSALTFGNQNVSIGANLGAASTLSANGVVSGNNALTFVGPGTLTLTGNNGYTGGTNILGGTLAIASDNAINNGVGGVTFGGTLQFNGAASSLNFNNIPNLSLGALTTATLSGNITGTSGLAYAGPGTLILNGANNYSGKTAINAGTLQIGDGSTNSTLGNGTGTVTDNATLVFDPANNTTMTIANAIGTTLNLTGNVVQNGLGTTQLRGNNTYTGNTTINNGTLQLAGSGTLGNTAGALTINTGNLDLNGVNATVGTLTGSGNVVNSNATGAVLSVGSGNGSSSFAGAISGATGLTKAGTGTLTLTGTSSYTGLTTVNAGILAIGSDAAINTGTGGFKFGSNGTLQLLGSAGYTSSNIPLATSGTLGVSLNNTVTLNGLVSGAGTVLTYAGPGTMVLGTASSTNTYTGGTVLTGGELSISAESNIGGPASKVTFSGGTLQIVGTAINNLATNTVNWSTFNGGLDIATAGNTFTVGTTIAGSGSVTTLGAGEVVLGQSDTYTGVTTVNGGTLQEGAINAIPNGGALTVGGGLVDLNSFKTNIGSLKGFGTISNFNNVAPVTVGTGNATGVFAGTIQGQLSLTKIGIGTLTLSGPNTYVDPTALMGGTLAISSDQSLGNGPQQFLSGTLQLDGYTSTLSFNNQTNLTLGANVGSTSVLAGNISGNSTLTYNGPGILALTGTNTFSGGTNQYNATTGVLLDAGELSISSQANIGAGPITFNGGTLQVTGTGNSLTLSNPIGVNTATSSSIFDVTTGNTLTLSGAAQNIKGANLTTIGGGTLILAGTGNAWTGTTTISNGGVLQIGDGGADGSIPATTTASTTTGINNQGVLVFNTQSNLTVNNLISGAGAVVQSGTGTTLLGGFNTFTGGTIINAGILKLGNAGALGTSVVTSTLTFNGGTLELNGFSPTFGVLQSAGGVGTITNSLSNTTSTVVVGNGNSTSTYTGLITDGKGTLSQVALYKIGTGVFNISGTNTFSGAVTIQAGAVAIGNDSALGTSGTVNFLGGTLLLNNYGSALSFANQPQLNLGANTGATSTLSGNITDGAGKTILTYSGPGVLALTGSNNYTGGTVINAGVLQIGNGGTTGSISSTGLITDNAVLSFNRSDSLFPFSSTITGNGGIQQNGSGTLQLNAVNTFLGATVVNSGAVQIGNGLALQNSSSVTLATGTSLDLNGKSTVLGGINGTGTITNSQSTPVNLTVGNNSTNGNFSGLIQDGSGALTLVKTGSGTISLNTPNTYSGGTVLNGGFISISADNEVGSGPVIFGSNGGGLLLGNGIVSNLNFGSQNVVLGASGGGNILSSTITNGGSLTFNGPGQLTLNGADTYTGGTTINGGLLRLGNSSGLGSPSGNLTINGGGLDLDGAGNIAFPTIINVGTLSGSSNATIDNFNNTSILVVNGGGNFAGAIQNTLGNVGLTLAGGTLTLSGVGSYNGATTLNGGTLILGTPNAATGTGGDATINNGSGGVVFNGGTLQFQSYASALSFTNAPQLNLAAAIGAPSSLSGVISDGAAKTTLNYAGPGTLLLTGNNTYTGGTNISNGTLAVAQDSAINAGVGGVNFVGTAGVLQFNGTTSTIASIGGSGQTVSLGVASGVTTALGTTTITGSTLNYIGPGTLNFKGANNTPTTNIKGGELVVSAVNGGLPTVGATPAINFTGGVLGISDNSISNFAGFIVNYTTFSGGLDIQSAGNTFTIGNAISGPGSFSKAGAGSLVLSAANSYSGGTTVNGGTLQFTGAGTLGAATGSLNVNAGGTLDLNGTSQSAGGLNGGGIIDNVAGGGTSTLTLGNGNANGNFTGTIQNTSGNVALVKMGSGNQILTGNNTYTGGTTINNGVLAIASDAAINNGTGGLAFGGGTLQLNNYASTNLLPLAANATGVKLGAAPGTPSSLAQGFLSGTSALTFVGPGTLVLNGNNSYTGGTTIGGGTLAIASDAAINNNGVGTIAFTGGALQFNGGYTSSLNLTPSPVPLLKLGAAPATAATLTTAITGTGTALNFVGPGNLVLSNTGNTYTGGTTLSGGELSISSASNVGGSLAPIVFNGGTLQITAAIPSLAITGTGFTGGIDVTTGNAFTTTALINGSGGLSKQGGGSLTLSPAASNTYTGGTFILGGTLVAGVTNALGTGAVSMGAGSTLDVHGFGTAVAALSGLGVIDNLSASSATFQTSSTSSTTYAGNIQSSVGILNFTKGVGSGTLTISGNNSYTGSTIISSSGGTLQLGSATALGFTSGVAVGSLATLNLGGFSNTITSAAPINNGVGVTANGTITSTAAATLTLNNTSATSDAIGNVISGAVALNLNTNGVNTGGFSLTAANTFTGGLTIGGGTVQMGSNVATALGGTSNPVTILGGTLDINNSNPTIGTLSGSGTITNTAAGKTNTVTIGNGNGSSTFAGNIVNGAGTVAITKTGTGTITLTGTASTYTGTTAINGGVLAITNDQAIPVGANITFGGGTLQFNNYSSNFILPSTQNLNLGAATGPTSDLNGPITGASSVKFVGPGILALNGNNNYLGGTTISGGELSISTLNSIGANSLNNPLPILNFSGGVLQVTGNALTNLNQAAVNGGSGGPNAAWSNFNGGFDIVSATNTFSVTQIVTGPVLQVLGSGTVVLSSVNNSITSSISINKATLQIGDGGIDGSLGAGAITDNGSLVFDSAGTIVSGPTKNILSFANTITGTGSITQLGTGTTSVTGANSFTGGTFLKAGILSINGDAAVGGSGAAVTFQGGELLYANPNTFPLNTALQFGTQNALIGASGTSPTVIGSSFSNPTPGGSLTFVGPGTLEVTGSNSNNGTNINGGMVIVATSNVNGGLGAGVQNVNSGGTLGTLAGTNGTVDGTVEVNAGGNLAPGVGSVLSIGNSAVSASLTLNQGAAISYTLSTPNVLLGGGTTNSIVTIPNGAFNILTNVTPFTGQANLTVNVNPGSKFAAGTVASPDNYVLFSTSATAPAINDQSGNFNGWLPQFSTWTLGTTAYVDFTKTSQTSRGATVPEVDLQVISGTPIVTTTSGPAFIIQSNGVKLDTPGTTAGTGVAQAPVTGLASATTNFYVVNQPYTSGNGNPVTKTNSFNEVTNTVGVPQTAPLLDPSGNTWISGFQYLAATVQYVDPPYTSLPHYLGESYNPIGGATDIFLADSPVAGGEFQNAPAGNTDAMGSLAGTTEFNGSFLSFLKSEFGSTFSDPGNLTGAQWAQIEGEFGVDSVNDVAWAVTDLPSGDYTVFGLVGAGVEATPLPTSLLGGLVLMTGVGVITARKRRRAL